MVQLAFVHIFVRFSLTYNIIATNIDKIGAPEVNFNK